MAYQPLPVYGPGSVAGGNDQGVALVGVSASILTDKTSDGKYIQRAVDQYGETWVNLGIKLDPVNDTIAAVQSGAWSMSILGGFINIGGSVLIQGGANSIITAGRPASVSGVGIFNTNPIGNGSVLALLQAGNAMIGSIAVFQAGVWAMPASGTYNVAQAAPATWGSVDEDTGHTSGDTGKFVLGVRNDTLNSIVTANLDYTPFAKDSAGRGLTKPFVSEDGTIISYTGSVVSGSVTLVQASAIGKRNYITDFWIANTGANTTLITFQGGDTSIIGRTIAPAGGGSNSPGINIPLKTTQSQDLAFQVASPSSIVYVTIKGYQAQ